jgi:putative SOS response-associated peptidase YedK
MPGWYDYGMCGKAAVSHLSWSDVFQFASVLKPPSTLPDDPITRFNVSPSRLRRKSEPESMVWETLPIIYAGDDADEPTEAIWPFIPVYSEGKLPMNREGRLISTANARLRHENKPFAPTFMGAWSSEQRVIIFVSWFYEFDSRVTPQIPYAVFPTNAPFWMMAGLARQTVLPDGQKHHTVTVITVEPNEVLKSVGHHRSPALLRSNSEANIWLHGNKDRALLLLRPHENESMGVEQIPMGVKIPGNENIELPEALKRRQ